MMSEDDILQDTCMEEIQNICNNASDWHEAIENIAEGFPHLNGDAIVKIITNHFFKKGVEAYD